MAEAIAQKFINENSLPFVAKSFGTSASQGRNFSVKKLFLQETTSNSKPNRNLKAPKSAMKSPLRQSHYSCNATGTQPAFAAAFHCHVAMSK